MCLYVDAIQHPHLCGKLFREVDIFALLLSEVVHLDGIQALVQVLEELPVLLSG